MGSRTPSAAPVTTDPWAAFGYIVSGVAVYGLAGWGLGQWLGASWLLPVGIVFGAVLGIYMVVARFRVGMAALDQQAQENPVDAEGTDGTLPATPTDRPSAVGAPGTPGVTSGRQTTSRGADETRER